VCTPLRTLSYRHALAVHSLLAFAYFETWAEISSQDKDALTRNIPVQIMYRKHTFLSFFRDVQPFLSAEILQNLKDFWCNLSLTDAKLVLKYVRMTLKE